MSTVQRVNWEPLSDILKLQLRDYPLADKTLADPSNAVCLVDGEFMTFDASQNLVRAADVTTTTAVASLLSFPLFAERGRTDIQAMANRKAPIIQFGDYEADTRIFDLTVAHGAGGGAAITTIMQPLKVGTVVLGTRNYVGLIGHGGASDTDPIVGLVTKLPATNGGKLRYMRFWRV
jgi:hypothetical protein